MLSTVNPVVTQTSATLEGYISDNGPTLFAIILTLAALYWALRFVSRSISRLDGPAFSGSSGFGSGVNGMSQMDDLDLGFAPVYWDEYQECYVDDERNAWCEA
jgi:hypothetical protein